MTEPRPVPMPGSPASSAPTPPGSWQSPPPGGWQQPPERDGSRGLLIAVVALLVALLLVGTALLVVVLGRNGGNPSVGVESGTATTASTPLRSTTSAPEKSTTSRPTSITTAPTTITIPPTIPPASSPTLPPSGGPVWFRTPSGNISCMMSIDTARCDIAVRDWSAQPTPASCPLDYGDALTVSAAGAEFMCHGDTVAGAPDVLPYGAASRIGAYECDSAESGVTCRNNQTGHGFFVARESYQLF